MRQHLSCHTEIVGANSAVYFNDTLILRLSKLSDLSSSCKFKHFFRICCLLPMISSMVSRGMISCHYIHNLVLSFLLHINRFTSLLSLKVVYGDSVISSDDKLLDKFKKVAHMIAEVGDAGGTVIDLFPICEHFQRDHTQLRGITKLSYYSASCTDLVAYLVPRSCGQAACR